ncbi:hypothetical protein LTR08_000059 [Meristemomyces frigidus]|nr:hypothetical protein LTR08_000059 [Meristemomyces frigidus]
MRAAMVLAAATAVSANLGMLAPKTSDYSAADVADGVAFNDVARMATSNMQYNVANRKATDCTFENADERQEWRTMDTATRKSFTDSVLCLMDMPPTHMTADQSASYPGVKSRHDEYVATHINLTYNVHDTADFFAWHRAFAHFWEKDLQSLCNYTGKLPYWNWAIDAQAPQDSSLFVGDQYSMGSNGKFIPNRTDTYLYEQSISMPPGTGGGCVESGPFSNITLNLGPLDLPNTDNVNSSFEYNPRCLSRDLNAFFTLNYNTYTNVTTTMLDNIYIEDFQDIFQGYGSSNKFGVHGGGHWATGGDMADFHSSPADPLFFLHHGQVDRIYTIWQNLDIDRRQTAIKGTSTLGNSPPSAEMQLSDTIPFGFVAADQTFGDFMDTFGGPLCYKYL